MDSRIGSSTLSFWLLAQNPRMRVVIRTPTAQPELSRLIHDCNGNGCRPSASRSRIEPGHRTSRSRSALPSNGFLKRALLQHVRGNELLLNVPLQNLDQKLPQVGAQRLRPWRPDKTFYRSA